MTGTSFSAPLRHWFFSVTLLALFLSSLKAEVPPKRNDVDNGGLTIGPEYKTDPDLTDHGNPHGKLFEFSLPLADSKIFKGNDSTLDPAKKPVNKTRKISVYVPATYHDGNKAPVLIIHDGPGQLNLVRNALDNLSDSKESQRKLPPFVAVAVQNGGNDGKKSERGLEYDTMSDRLARFIHDEVLSAVATNAEIKATYPRFALTQDPWGRAVMGCSSGGAAALTMGWFRPDLFRRIIAYSGTFVDQQDDDAPEEAKYPLGAWEYHSGMKLIETSERKPLRIFTHVSENDLRSGEPEETHHNWVMAGKRTDAALTAKGYDHRFVYSLGTSHCDHRVFQQTLADTLVWIWRGYQPERIDKARKPLSQFSPLFDQNAKFNSPQIWNKKRNELRTEWLKIIGGLPSAKLALKTRKLGTENLPEFIREHIEYQVEPGVYTDGYLLTPKGLKGRLPGLVVFHATSEFGARGAAGLEPTYPEEKRHGLQLVRKGYVVWCPRNFINAPGADYAGNAAKLLAKHTGWTGMGRMTWDAIRAADFLETCPQVDHKRIGCFGHSLGAKEVLYAMAFDERYRAGIFSEGGIGLNFSNWNAAWYLGKRIPKPESGLNHHQLLALIAPRPFLLLAGDSADDESSELFIKAARPAYALYNAGSELKFFDHHQGHIFNAEQRALAEPFLDHFLRPAPGKTFSSRSDI